MKKILPCAFKPRARSAWPAAIILLLFAGCVRDGGNAENTPGAKTGGADDAREEPAAVSEVWLHVAGMMKVQGIT